MDNSNTPAQNPIPVPPAPPSLPPVQQPIKNGPTAARMGMKKIGLLILGVVVVLVIAFVVVKKNSGTVTHGKLDPNPVVAVVGDKKIYEHDVVKEAQKQYQPSAINPDVMKIFTNTLVEHAILENEARKSGLDVTNDEVEKAAGKDASDTYKEVVRYNLLKAKVMAQQIQSVEAYTIGFYIAGYEYPQKPEYNIQRTDGKKALSEIETRLKNKENPLAVTKVIYQKYPSLQNILALNALLYKNDPNNPQFTAPKVIAVNSIDPKSSSYDPVYYQVITSIKENEVKKGERIEDGSGGFVMSAIKVNSTGYKTYEDFLSAKKQEYVKMYRSL